jgi:uncharacterized protein
VRRGVTRVSRNAIAVNRCETEMNQRMIPVVLGNLFSNLKGNEAWLVLADESGKRGIPMYIGGNNMVMTASTLGRKGSRPMTYQFFANVLGAIGAELVEVQVISLERSTFKAVALLRANGKEHRVDARPSDAVPLAAVMKQPIFVSEEVMSVAGRPLGVECRPEEVPAEFVSLKHFWTEPDLAKNLSPGELEALMRQLAHAMEETMNQENSLEGLGPSRTPGTKAE